MSVMFLFVSFTSFCRVLFFYSVTNSHSLSVCTLFVWAKNTHRAEIDTILREKLSLSSVLENKVKDHSPSLPYPTELGS